MLIYRLGGQFDAETFEGLDINLRQHDGGVNLAAAQFFELFQGDLCVFVGSGAHGQRDQNFIGVETRVAASEVLDFQLLDRLDRDREIRCSSCGILPSTLTAFRSRAAEAPSRLVVFPVAMVPSGSSMAAAGAPVSSAAFQGSRNNAASVNSSQPIPRWEFA